MFSKVFYFIIDYCCYIFVSFDFIFVIMPRKPITVLNTLSFYNYCSRSDPRGGVLPCICRMDMCSGKAPSSLSPLPPSPPPPPPRFFFFFFFFFLTRPAKNNNTFSLHYICMFNQPQKITFSKETSLCATAKFVLKDLFLKNCLLAVN